MEHKFVLAAQVEGDGSTNVWLVNTEKEAYEKLGREEGSALDNYYDDGLIEHITLEIDSEGKLLKPFHINIE